MQILALGIRGSGRATVDQLFNKMGVHYVSERASKEASQDQTKSFLERRDLRDSSSRVSAEHYY